MGREEQITGERIRKLNELKKAGINPYPYKFDVSNYSQDLQEKYKKLKNAEFTKDTTKIAGRIAGIRDIGKIIFIVLQDGKGKIQVVLQEKETPDKVREFFKKYIDTGDFIGIEGTIFRTQRGELSVLAKKLELLSKSLLPLPEKWHGLQDKEERYRKRYLDLIMSPEVKEVFKKRAKIISLIRKFLDEKNFLEVETPLLQPLYGGAAARPFVTELYALKMRLFLSISPEIYLKKLLVGGIDRVYTICKNFRNEGIDKWHNPEFTMIEIYQSYADYNDMMDLAEKLISSICKEINGTTKVNLSGKEIDLTIPFTRLRMDDAIKKYCKINPNEEKSLMLEAKKLGIPVSNKDEAKNALFEEKVQPLLIQPTFILDYPSSLCPLTKEHRKDPNLVERFELFINGAEIANAYSELNDPQEQENKLKEQLKSRKEEAHAWANELDTDFINSLKYGMPPAGGIGIGIDRLVLLITSQESMRDVILFPFMKPEVKEEIKEETKQTKQPKSKTKPKK